MFDWLAFFEGFALDGILVLTAGILLTPWLVELRLKQRLPILFREFISSSDNDDLFASIRQRILNGLMGSKGGRPADPKAALLQLALSLFGRFGGGGGGMFGSLLQQAAPAEVPA